MTFPNIQFLDYFEAFTSLPISELQIMGNPGVLLYSILTYVLWTWVSFIYCALMGQLAQVFLCRTATYQLIPESMLTYC